MTFAIIQVICIQLILPVIFIATLWKGKFTSKFQWIIQVVFNIVFMSWLFFSGSWDFLGVYVRYIFIIFLLIAIFQSWKNIRSLPFWLKSIAKQKWNIGIYVFLIFIFGMYNVFIMTSHIPDDEPIELAFPLKSGTYYIGHGGSNTFMNYHSDYPPQKYALDILKLNQFGTRAKGLYPKELDKYAIYQDALYSPCNGEILEARGHLPDLTPPDTDPENALGNYVALSCENTDAIVYMAHMEKDSVIVQEGSGVQVGDQVGTIGNSGNTTEPHLHIHAEIDGEGVPITFDGKFLVRNQLVK